ncbi:MAG: hypothetical protein WBD07_18365 [Vicinamibacterales bacterium]
MRLLVVLVLIEVAAACPSASAQEPPPRLPIVVVDLHGTVPNFSDDPRLAASRGLSQAQLPGLGIGGAVGAHVYPFRWRAVTFGIGGQLTVARARQSPAASGQTPALAPVTARFRSIAPEVSFNFGTGDGWSYLSGGLSTSTWSIVPDGAASVPGDDEALKTINYGGGARWFAKPHLAFSFDVRFYAISPGTSNGSPSGTGSPRTTMVIVGAGVSLK